MLKAFITHINDYVKYATVSESDSSRDSDNVLKTCNYRVDGWRDAVVTCFGERGLIVSDVKCISEGYFTTRADGLIYPSLQTPNSGNGDGSNNKDFEDVYPRSFSADSVYTVVRNHTGVIVELGPKGVVDNT